MALPASLQSPKPSHAENVTAGILMMLATVFMFAVIDGCAKYLVGQLPPMLVVAARYGLSMIYVIGLMWWTGTLSFRSNHPWLQFLRGAMLLSTTVMNFIALQYLRLDQTAAIFFSNPLWVCALSPLLLGERVGPRRWAAVIVGFFGVLTIIRPGGDSFHWAMLLSLAVAIIAALYQITTRKIGGKDPALVSLLLASGVGAVASAPLGVAQWQTPTVGLLAIMLLMGLSGGLAHHLLIKAHTIAPAPTLAPFIYTQMIWMILVGYIFFNDVPDGWTVLGAGIVVASGLYVYYREQALIRKSR